jgi:hypothetical protein
MLFPRQPRIASARLCGSKSERVNLFGRVREIGRRVKRWQNGTMVLHWTAAGVLQAERSFHKVTGYRELPKLVAALRLHQAMLGLPANRIDGAKAAV